MVGYLKPNFKNVPKEYKTIYKSYYCGLCKALKSQYKHIGILSLNYEITAFLLLLNSMNEEKQRCFHGSCSISPFVPVRYINYLQEDIVNAAHLSVLIAYYEIKDNNKDIGGIKWNTIEKYVANKSKKSIYALADDYNNIKSAVENFYAIENSKTVNFDDIIESDGELIKSFLSILIKHFDVDTTNKLLELSKLLGEWIYLIDACDDLQKDIKDNNFNPLLLLSNIYDVKKNINSIENGITQIINELPILNYEGLVNYIFIENLNRTSQQYLTKLSG